MFLTDREGELMKRLFVIGVCMFAVVLMSAGIVPAQTKEAISTVKSGTPEDVSDNAGIVDDITEEVLTGPSDLDPEKILGPGGVAIDTEKDILMSFGATVRFIPTSESNWDFGLSDEVPGYVNTTQIKNFAGGGFNSANAAMTLDTATESLKIALAEDRDVQTAFDNFAGALYELDTVIGRSPTTPPASAAGIKQAADGAAQIQSLADAAAAGGGDPDQVIQNLAPNVIDGADTIVGNVTDNILGDNPSYPDPTITEALAYVTILKARADSFKPYYLADSFLRTHSNESGSVNDGYIRNETKMYFNAMARDKKWSFYGALEFDRPIDTASVDNRGGKVDTASNFGLERLNASVELVPGLRFHAGWDVWGLDIIEAASMVYGDDNAGFWLKGDYGDFHYSAAWLKLEENDFQIDATQHSGAVDEDRDLLAGYLDYHFRESDKIRFFYGYDRIRNVPASDLLGSLAREANLEAFAGINGDTPSTDAHSIGAYYLGKFGILELMTEGVYKFGKADDTGLLGQQNGVYVNGQPYTIEHNDFDISSYAFAADVALELGELVGWMSLKPHLGFMYTSGDDDFTDDELNGYSGIENAQRFSGMWGGENTIIGDTNFVLGTALYGYLPEFYGNGTPVFVGGLQNFAGNGNGRGDNPGLTMYSVGFTMRPKIFLIYRTNVNMFHWNEDFYVTDMVDPVPLETLLTGNKKQATKVSSGYVGTEWDNELTLALSKHTFIKGQAALFFPGEGVEDATAALSGGTETDEIATRIAAELIWNF